ncbi:MAG: hypothetical protein EP330_09330 [Deltaproteobacteria bacterium]|nr:MAG: hypothetical protein EP330_09330 [Deltaproteobacteria bacterium]
MPCPHSDERTCPTCLARRGAGGAVVLLGLGAFGPGCASAEYGAVVTSEDLDLDGYETPLDCDDSDASVNPGADDPEGDGIDQNCDGVDGVADSGM